MFKVDQSILTLNWGEKTLEILNSIVFCMSPTYTKTVCDAKQLCLCEVFSLFLYAQISCHKIVQYHWVLMFFHNLQTQKVHILYNEYTAILPLQYIYYYHYCYYCWFTKLTITVVIITTDITTTTIVKLLLLQLLPFAVVRLPLL